MKTKIFISSIMAVGCMAWVAGAAEQPKGAEELRNTQNYADRFSRSNVWERLGTVNKASEVIGMEIRNYQNEKLGKIDELAVDLESGRVVQAVLSIGGFLGLGDRLVAVPPSTLHIDSAKKVVHLDADKEKLKASPPFEMTKWEEYSTTNYLGEVYHHYGQEPYFNVPKSRLGHVMRATKVIGLPVKNLQDEKLGKVDNLTVDLMGARLVTVIISSGGFLGLGNELSAVPPAALRFNSERNALILDATKESLTQAPRFQSNQWPDVGQPAYVVGVYQAYKVEPYFSTNAADADNTARNVRDRNDRSVTPLDQGNSSADIGTTARIRKEILAEKGFSVNARNIKVITSNGRVTLRGPVNSDEEKRRITEIANRIATADNVVNQLDVKRVAIDSDSTK